MNDWQLLQDYLEHGSEAAFRALVDRHLGLVYATAQRQVNDPQLAEDIAQTVFILLVKKARGFGQGVVLAGWLFRTARFVAAGAMRSERRRQQREKEAFEMHQLHSTDSSIPPSGIWLDEAIARLGAKDRDAVLLRFAHDHSFREVGERLGLSEEAAKKRVNRAVERLRAFVAKRGVVLSAASLAGAIAQQLTQGAPADLAARVTAKSLETCAATGTALPPLVSQTLKAWRLAKLKWAGVSATATIALVLAVNALMPNKPAGPGGAVSGGKNQPAIPQARDAKLIPNAGRDDQRTQRDQRILRFHVVAKDSGEPVALANLAINTVIGDEWKQRFDLATDDTGWADVPYPTDTWRLDVGVLSWGWAARTATWMPFKEDPVPNEYTLRVDRLTNSIGGWLRDEKDQPVANAEVLVDFINTGDAVGRENTRECIGFVLHAMVAHSGQDGRWACAVIPPNKGVGFRIEARHPDFRPAPITSSGFTRDDNNSTNKSLSLLWDGKLVTRMGAGLTMTGQVLDESGQPISQALVVHEPHNIDAVIRETDMNGWFAIPKLSTGDYDFTVSKTGYAPEYRKVDVQQGMKPVEVRLKPGALLRLRLVDEFGAEVPGATVSLEQWGEYRLKLKWSEESGPDGRIEWNSAPRQAVLELCAYKPDWCYTRDIRLKADGAEHVITMQRTLMVTGRVTDAATGEPVAEVKACPGCGEGAYMWKRIETRRGTNGLYKVYFNENRRPWRVRVEAQDYEPFVSEPLRPDFSGALDVALRRLGQK